MIMKILPYIKVMKFGKNKPFYNGAHAGIKWKAAEKK
jgi:hypothetical protein